MTRSLSILLPVALLGTIACSETNIDRDQDPEGLEQKLPACIEVSPRNLAFADIEIANKFEPEELTVTVSNIGGENCGGDLEILGVDFKNTSHPGVFKIANIDEVFLGPGETTDFTVSFAPKFQGEFSGRIEVQSSDLESPSEIVRIDGNGIAPEIQVTPETYDYGAPYIGCENGQPFTVTNQGNADLIVEQVELFTSAETEYDVDLDPINNGPLPFTLAPFEAANNGPSADVYLDYLPLDDFPDSGTVTFRSNDPFLPAKNVFAEGNGVIFGDNIDTFEQPLKSATDIMFTLDRSCSMFQEAEAVLNNFDAFIETLASLDADYHAAVVVGDSGCVVGPDGYVDNTFSESAATDAFRTMIDWDRSLAGYGSNTERQLMLMEAGLSNANTGAGGCNADFYREDAFLSLVGVTDEPDQSVNSWSYYVALFQSIKTNPDDVRVNAVAGDYPSGCSSAQAGTKIYEASVATGGLFLSICSSDWSEKLESLAAESVSINDSFELTQQPVPQTIEVNIDGQLINVGWEYEITSNSVVFDRDRIPAGGSTIEIFYQRLPDCGG
ncbi:MAG: choice-of-anchor D domain-containing protein [Myxococcota bacterium]